MRQYFRFTGNYYLAGHDDQDLPIFKKKSNDIMMYYNHQAYSWVIKNSEQNMIFAVSSSISPNFVDSADWNIKESGHSDSEAVKISEQKLRFYLSNTSRCRSRDLYFILKNIL